MEFEKQVIFLRKIQEMEFVAVELNLYLDTHPSDHDALNDFNCAVESLEKLKDKYETEYGPLLNFGFSRTSREAWQWVQGPWPWEV